MESKIKLIQRLRRVEGQIRGLQRMIQGGRDCEEIITQFSSIVGALKGAGFMIVQFYLHDCLDKNLQQNESIEKVEKDIHKVIKTFISSV